MMPAQTAQAVEQVVGAGNRSAQTTPPQHTPLFPAVVRITLHSFQPTEPRSPSPLRPEAEPPRREPSPARQAGGGGHAARGQ